MSGLIVRQADRHRWVGRQAGRQMGGLIGRHTDAQWIGRQASRPTVWVGWRTVIWWVDKQTDWLGLLADRWVGWYKIGYVEFSVYLVILFPHLLLVHSCLKHLQLCFPVQNLRSLHLHFITITSYFIVHYLISQSQLGIDFCVLSLISNTLYQSIINV